VTDPSLHVTALLGLAALGAGFIDAVVGGGALVQIPALLAGLPGYAPVHILATNKASSICGTLTSAATYGRRVPLDRRVYLPLAGLAFGGSLAGAALASHLSTAVFRPLVLAALLIVGAWVVFRPALGSRATPRYRGARQLTLAMAIGVLIGFYDGALGPGTGSFFVITLVGLLGYSFVQATAKAKIANAATNLAALVIFIPQGAVLWKLAIVMGACNLVGGYAGARLAVARGAGFIRALLILVLAGFSVRIAGQLAGWWS
jgi:uncharacterized membrane protein YfcA